MSESTNPEPAFFSARTAYAIGGALVLGLGGVTAYAVLDRPRAGGVESFSETTAVGDKVYFRPPVQPLAVPDPVLTWQGRKWAPANYEKLKIDDTRMFRAGRDPETRFSVYREKGKGPESPKYLKMDTGEYLRLEAR